MIEKLKSSQYSDGWWKWKRWNELDVMRTNPHGEADYSRKIWFKR